MYRVTCLQCKASVIVPDGNSDALACTCCPESHSHEAAANACDGSHDGACGLAAKDCTVFRPCEISFTGAVPVGGVN